MLKEFKASEFFLWQNLVISGEFCWDGSWFWLLVRSQRCCGRWWLCPHQQLVLCSRSRTVMPIANCWSWRPNVHMNVFLRCWASSGLVPQAPPVACMPGVCSWRAAPDLVTPRRNPVSGLQGSSLFYWESCWCELQIGVDTAVKCLVLSLEYVNWDHKNRLLEEMAILVLTYCWIKSRSIKNYYIKKILMLLIWFHIQEKIMKLFLGLKLKEKGESAWREQKCQKHHCSYLSRIAAVFWHSLWWLSHCACVLRA